MRYFIESCKYEPYGGARGKLLVFPYTFLITVEFVESEGSIMEIKESGPLLIANK